MPLKDRNDTLHTLSTLGNVGIVCACTSRYDLYCLYSCVGSRLNVQIIGFPPYLDDELVHILINRASHALKPDTWSMTHLEQIASMAQGDSRIAIQTLRSASNFAEREFKGFLESEHLHKRFSSTRELKQLYVSKKMTEHHQLLYEIVKKNKKLLSGELYNLYRDACIERDWVPIARRIFYAYYNALMQARLIHGKRARVRGKVMEFNPAE